jgi:hypothetical protein
MSCRRSRRAGRPGARLALAGAFTLALSAASTESGAQVTVLGRPVATAAIAAPSLGVSVSWAGALAIPALQDDTRNDFPVPVTVTVSWSGMSTPMSLCAVGYFQNPSAALVSGSDVIPASAVHGRVTGAGPTTPYTPFTQTGCTGGVGTSGASLELLEHVLTGTGSASATLSLRLDLTGRPVVPAGQYVGTLNIRAVVQ